MLETLIKDKIETSMIRIETQNLITGKDTISASYHSAQENKQIWNNYDWSNYGEEWTDDVRLLRGLDPIEWKNTVRDEMILKHFRNGSTLLEIGPGAGRWTSILLELAGNLILADISEKCLQICRERFKSYSNIQYFLINNGSLEGLDYESVDGVWSYDAFVHISPAEIEDYLASIKRVLKPGGCAVIHHAGTYVDEVEARKKRFRSYIDAPLFQHLVRKYGMQILEQNDSLPHLPGDIISVFQHVQK